MEEESYGCHSQVETEQGTELGTRGRVSTQHQLEGTISAQHTEQWLPNTGVWPAGNKLGRISLEGLLVPHGGGAKPITAHPPYPLSPLTHGLASGSVSLPEQPQKIEIIFLLCWQQRKWPFFLFPTEEFLPIRQRPQTSTVLEKEQGRRQMDPPLWTPEKING